MSKKKTKKYIRKTIFWVCVFLGFIPYYYCATGQWGEGGEATVLVIFYMGIIAAILKGSESK